MKKRNLFKSLMCLSLSIIALTSCNKGGEVEFTIKWIKGNEEVALYKLKKDEVITKTDKVIKAEEPYSKDGKYYTFDGWYDGNDKFTDGLKATKDITYVAKFNESDIPVTYKVTWTKEGESEPFTTLTINAGDKIVKNSIIEKAEEDYIKDGKKYTFKRWYDETNKVEYKDDMVASKDLNFKAEFNTTQGYKVTFKDEEGEIISPTYNDVNILTSDMIPDDQENYTKDYVDYIFDCYQTEDKKPIKAKEGLEINKDMTFVAHFLTKDHKYSVRLVDKVGQVETTNVTYTKDDDFDAKRNDVLNVMKYVRLVSPSTIDTFNNYSPILPKELPISDEVSEGGDINTYTYQSFDKYFTLDFSNIEEVSKRFDYFDLVNLSDDEDSNIEYKDNKFVIRVKNDNAIFQTGLGEEDFTIKMHIASSDDSINFVFGINNEEYFNDFSGLNGDNLITGEFKVNINPSEAKPITIFENDANPVNPNPKNAYTPTALSNGVDLEVSIVTENNFKYFDASINDVHILREKLNKTFTPGMVLLCNKNTDSTKFIELSNNFVVERFNPDFNYDYSSKDTIGSNLNLTPVATSSPSGSLSVDTQNHLLVQKTKYYNLTTSNIYHDFELEFEAKTGTSGKNNFAVFFSADNNQISLPWWDEEYISALSKVNGAAAVGFRLDNNEDKFVNAMYLENSAWSIKHELVREMSGTSASFKTDFVKVNIIVKDAKVTVSLDDCIYATFSFSQYIRGYGRVGISIQDDQCGISYKNIKIKSIDNKNVPIDYNYVGSTDNAKNVGKNLLLSKLSNEPSKTPTAEVVLNSGLETEFYDDSLYTTTNYNDFELDFTYKSKVEGDGNVLVGFGEVYPELLKYAELKNSNEHNVLMQFSLSGEKNFIKVLFGNDEYIFRDSLEGFNAKENFVNIKIKFENHKLSLLLDDLKYVFENLDCSAYSGRILFSRASDNTHGNIFSRISIK